MSEKVFEYINEKLFTEEQPVLFTDLIFRFKVGPSKAKSLMYGYYKQNTNTKFNCIIICVSGNGNIKVIQDLSNVDDAEALVDCFIYAFNPMDAFTPVSTARDLQDLLPIRNPYELKVTAKRAKTVEVQPTVEPKPVPAARSRTVPESRETTKKQPVKSKDSGLRSTAILAKMRGEREKKERERREGLNRRRQEQLERDTKNDKKRSAQMEELNNLFDDEESMTGDDPLPSSPVESRDETPVKEESEPIDKQELEELLETTTQDSLMHNSTTEPARNTPGHGADAESSYVDEDGYTVTVTNRVATSTPPAKRPASVSATKPDIPTKKRAPRPKRTQGTLESFFKKK